MSAATDLKSQVQAFWNQGSCGEAYATGISEREYYDSHSASRYRLEPYLAGFAEFAKGRGKDVLEIGVGMGADHVEWAKSQPRTLTGIDLTPRAVEHTQKRFKLYGLQSHLQVADAESLPFADASFDLVYSWGVLHHSPHTAAAINEVYRVLRPGGTAKIMIYHTYSLTGYMLWLRYALITGRPTRSLRDIYAAHLESPGTKAYSVAEAQQMFEAFEQAEIRPQLCLGDLLEGAVGQRHRGPLLAIAKWMWPRAFLRTFFKKHGLFLLIEAIKPQAVVNTCKKAA